MPDVTPPLRHRHRVPPARTVTLRLEDALNGSTPIGLTAPVIFGYLDRHQQPGARVGDAGARTRSLAFVIGWRSRT